MGRDRLWTLVHVLSGQVVATTGAMFCPYFSLPTVDTCCVNRHVVWRDRFLTTVEVLSFPANRVVMFSVTTEVVTTGQVVTDRSCSVPFTAHVPPTDHNVGRGVHER